MTSPVTRALLTCPFVGAQTHLLHHVEDAALHGLEAVAGVGEGTRINHRVGVFQEAGFHLGGYVDVDDILSPHPPGSHWRWIWIGEPYISSCRCVFRTSIQRVHAGEPGSSMSVIHGDACAPKGASGGARQPRAGVSLIQCLVMCAPVCVVK